MAKKYRYPGAKPFQTTENHIFFGRQDNANKLYDLINIEQLVILHSKSGMGKSSLINAGLIPIIKKEADYDIFEIRFYTNSKSKESHPLATTLNILKGESDILDKVKPQGENSLWYHIKCRQLSGNKDKGIFLIFDQFEELFTYDDEAVFQFASQLSEVLYSTLPQRFREERRKAFAKNKDHMSSQELDILDEPINIKILMAIRSDRMSLLKKLKEYLPNILAADYELLPLNRIQAEDAILSPAYQKNDFLTPVFDYEEAAIEYLLDYLSKGGQENIESFQLQILGEYVEQMVVEKQKKTLITKEDLVNPSQILENYYLNKIRAISDPKDQVAARKFIEEGLIFEEEQRRLSLYEGQIHKDYGISQSFLQALLDTHIIRSEPSTQGGFTYELSHDTLVAPVLFAKRKRLAVEEQAAAELALKEQEQKVALLKEAAEKERREKVKARRIALAGILLALFSLLATFAALYQSYNLKEAKETISNNYETIRQKDELTSLRNLQLQEKNDSLNVQGVLLREQKSTLFIEQQKTQNLLNITKKANRDLALQKQKAEKARNEADLSAAKAETARQIALESEKIAKAKAEEATIAKAVADKKRAEAEEARSITENLRLQSLAKALALKSIDLTSPNKDLKILLSSVAYQILEESGHNNFNPDLYNCLYDAYKHSVGDSFNIIPHERETINALHYDEESNTFFTTGTYNTSALKIVKRNKIDAPDISRVTSIKNSSSCNTLDISPNRKWLLFGGKEAFMRAVERKNPELEHKFILNNKQSEVFDILFTDNNNFISISNDNILRHYTIDNFSNQGLYKLPFTAKVLANHPSEKGLIFIGCGNGDLILIDHTSFNQAKHWASKTIGNTITSIEVDQNAKLVFIGHENGEVGILDFSKNDEIEYLKPNPHVASIADFSIKNGHLAIASYDGSCSVWNLSAIEDSKYFPLTIKDNDTWVTAVMFLDSEKELITATRDGTIKYWNLDHHAYAKEICDKTSGAYDKKELEKFIGEDYQKYKGCKD